MVRSPGCGLSFEEGGPRSRGQGCSAGYCTRVGEGEGPDEGEAESEPLPGSEDEGGEGAPEAQGGEEEGEGEESEALESSVDRGPEVQPEVALEVELDPEMEFAHPVRGGFRLGLRWEMETEPVRAAGVVGVVAAPQVDAQVDVF